jgi:membrane protein implicated in regulation of membrane protease activity
MRLLLVVSPFLSALILGLALGVASMLGGIDRHLKRRGRVSPWNMPTIAAFFIVFGAVGYPLARYAGARLRWALPVALACGLAAGVGVFALIAGWVVPSAANDVEDPRYALQGHFGRVTTAISDGGVGEIAYEHDGVRRASTARALDGKAIGEGTEVVIERVEDGVAYVQLWSTIARDLELPA